MVSLCKRKLLGAVVVLIMTALTTKSASSARISTKHAAGSKNHHGAIVMSTGRISNSTNFSDFVPSVITKCFDQFHNKSIALLNRELGDEQQPRTTSFDCASRDDDLACTRSATTPSTFYFDFTPSIWGTTLFWCNFVMGVDPASFRDAHVVVYPGDGYSGRQPFECTHCTWDVRVDGFYRSNTHNPLNLIERWSCLRLSQLRLMGQCQFPALQSLGC